MYRIKFFLLFLNFKYGYTILNDAICASTFNGLWLNNTQSCFTFNQVPVNKTQTWTQSFSMCQKYKNQNGRFSRLANIVDAATWIPIQSWLNKNYANFTANGAWFGLYRVTLAGNPTIPSDWKHINHLGYFQSSLNADNLSSMNITMDVVNITGQHLCVSTVNNTNWQPRLCNVTLPFICEIYELTTVGYQLCPEGWIRVNSQCYVPILSSSFSPFIQYSNAQSACAAIGGNLPSFQNVTDWEAFNSYRQKLLLGNHTVWIGAKKTTNAKGYQYTDGQTFSELFWNTKQPKQLSLPHCVASPWYSTNSSWNTASCTTSNIFTICQIQCKWPFLLSYGICVLDPSSNTKFIAAYDKCNTLNASLPIFHNSLQWQVLLTYLSNNNITDNFWLGTVSTYINPLYWANIDYSKFDWSIWFNGVTPKSGSCSYADALSGYMKNDTCYKNYYTICTYFPAVTTDVCPIVNDSYSLNWQLGTYSTTVCYRYLFEESPTNVSNALKLCKSIGGNLPTMYFSSTDYWDLMRYTGILNSTLNLMPNNVWLGISQQMEYGTWQSMEGFLLSASFANTMWLSGNSASQINNFVYTDALQSSKWISDQMSSLHHVVCEYRNNFNLAKDNSACLNNLTTPTYYGTKSSTISGLSCIDWSLLNDQTTFYLPNNYCRNVLKSLTGPWCYTGNGSNTESCFYQCPCASSPCFNNATCIPNNQNYTCNCLPQYYGDRCEYLYTTSLIYQQTTTLSTTSSPSSATSETLTALQTTILSTAATSSSLSLLALSSSLSSSTTTFAPVSLVSSPSLTSSPLQQQPTSFISSSSTSSSYSSSSKSATLFSSPSLSQLQTILQATTTGLTSTQSANYKMATIPVTTNQPIHFANTGNNLLTTTTYTSGKITTITSEKQLFGESTISDESDKATTTVEISGINNAENNQPKANEPANKATKASGVTENMFVETQTSIESTTNDEGDVLTTADCDTFNNGNNRTKCMVQVTKASGETETMFVETQTSIESTTNDEGDVLTTAECDTFNNGNNKTKCTEEVTKASGETESISSNEGDIITTKDSSGINNAENNNTDTFEQATKATKASDDTNTNAAITQRSIESTTYDDGDMSITENCSRFNNGNNKTKCMEAASSTTEASDEMKRTTITEVNTVKTEIFSGMNNVKNSKTKPNESTTKASSETKYNSEETQPSNKSDAVSEHVMSTTMHSSGLITTKYHSTVTNESTFTTTAASEETKPNSEETKPSSQSDTNDDHMLSTEDCGRFNNGNKKTKCAATTTKASGETPEEKQTANESTVSNVGNMFTSEDGINNPKNRTTEANESSTKASGETKHIFVVTQMYIENTTNSGAVMSTTDDSSGINNTKYNRTEPTEPTTKATAASGGETKTNFEETQPSIGTTTNDGDMLTTEDCRFNNGNNKTKCTESTTKAGGETKSNPGETQTVFESTTSNIGNITEDTSGVSNAKSSKTEANETATKTSGESKQNSVETQTPFERTTHVGGVMVTQEDSGGLNNIKYSSSKPNEQATSAVAPSGYIKTTSEQTQSSIESTTNDGVMLTTEDCSKLNSGNNKTKCTKAVNTATEASEETKSTTNNDGNALKTVDTSGMNNTQTNRANANESTTKASDETKHNSVETHTSIESATNNEGVMSTTEASSGLNNTKYNDTKPNEPATTAISGETKTNSEETQPSIESTTNSGGMLTTEDCNRFSNGTNRTKCAESTTKVNGETKSNHVEKQTTKATETIGETNPNYAEKLASVESTTNIAIHVLTTEDSNKSSKTQPNELPSIAVDYQSTGFSTANSENDMLTSQFFSGINTIKNGKPVVTVVVTNSAEANGENFVYTQPHDESATFIEKQSSSKMKPNIVSYASTNEINGKTTPAMESLENKETIFPIGISRAAVDEISSTFEARGFLSTEVINTPILKEPFNSSVSAHSALTTTMRFMTDEENSSKVSNILVTTEYEADNSKIFSTTHNLVTTALSEYLTTLGEMSTTTTLINEENFSFQVSTGLLSIEQTTPHPSTLKITETTLPINTWKMASFPLASLNIVTNDGKSYTSVKTSDSETNLHTVSPLTPYLETTTELTASNLLTLPFSTLTTETVFVTKLQNYSSIVINALKLQETTESNSLLTAEPSENAEMLTTPFILTVKPTMEADILSMFNTAPSNVETSQSDKQVISSIFSTVDEITQSADHSVPKILPIIETASVLANKLNFATSALAQSTEELSTVEISHNKLLMSNNESSTSALSHIFQQQNVTVASKINSAHTNLNNQISVTGTLYTTDKMAHTFMDPFHSTRKLAVKNKDSTTEEYHTTTTAKNSIVKTNTPQKINIVSSTVDLGDKSETTVTPVIEKYLHSTISTLRFVNEIKSFVQSKNLPISTTTRIAATNDNYTKRIHVANLKTSMGELKNETFTLSKQGVTKRFSTVKTATFHKQTENQKSQIRFSNIMDTSSPDSIRHLDFFKHFSEDGQPEIQNGSMQINQNKSDKKERKPYHVMNQNEFVASVVVQTMGCTVAMACIGATLALFLVFGGFSTEKLIIFMEDISLMFAYCLVLTLREPRLFNGMSKQLCTMVAVALQYFYTSAYTFMFLESLQMMAIITKVKLSGSLFPWYANLLIGWGIPLVIIGITVPIMQDDYSTSWTCWGDMGGRFNMAIIVPLIVLCSATAAVVESAGITGRKEGKNSALFSKLSNPTQLLSAKISQRSVVFVMAATVCSHLTGLMAVYFQLLQLYVACFFINVFCGCSVFMFHTAMDSKYNPEVFIFQAISARI